MEGPAQEPLVQAVDEAGLSVEVSFTVLGFKKYLLHQAYACWL